MDRVDVDVARQRPLATGDGAKTDALLFCLGREGLQSTRVYLFHVAGGK